MDFSCLEQIPVLSKTPFGTLDTSYSMYSARAAGVPAAATANLIFAVVLPLLQRYCYHAVSISWNGIDACISRRDISAVPNTPVAIYYSSFLYLAIMFYLLKSTPSQPEILKYHR